MNKDHKFFISVMAMMAVLVAIFLILMGRANAQVLVCPAGTYDAGGFCKNEPTGCPYGDSIPLDSPKCIPPTTPQLAEYGALETQTTNDGAVVTEESWGK